VARELRPRNEFEYFLVPPDGRRLERRASSGFLGDVRLAAGHRHTRHWQTTLAVTLPTTTGPTGYGRGVVSVSAITTARAALDHRWTTELSAGLGYTPRHGDLSTYQRTVFRSLSGGMRYRFWGKQAVFINLFYQSASYRGTGMRAMDNRELTLDYGFLLRARKGPEWFLGMTEDLEPRGPAVDLSFRIGARW